MWECTWDLLGFLQQKKESSLEIQQAVIGGHIAELGALFVSKVCCLDRWYNSKKKQNTLNYYLALSTETVFAL